MLLVWFFGTFNLFQLNPNPFVCSFKHISTAHSDVIISIREETEMAKASKQRLKQIQKLKWLPGSFEYTGGVLNFTRPTPNMTERTNDGWCLLWFTPCSGWRLRARKEWRKQNHFDPKSGASMCVWVCVFAYDYSLAHLSGGIIYYVLTAICSSFCKLATHIILWVWLQLSLRRQELLCSFTLCSVCRVSCVVCACCFILFVCCENVIYTLRERECGCGQRGGWRRRREEAAKLMKIKLNWCMVWENKRLRMWIWIECFCSRTTTTKYTLYTSCCCLCRLHVYGYATYFISFHIYVRMLHLNYSTYEIGGC